MNDDKTAEQLRVSHPTDRDLSYLLALSELATNGPYQWHPGSDNVVAWNGEDMDICAVYQDEKDTKKTGEFIAAACNFVRKYGEYLATLDTRTDSGEAVADLTMAYRAGFIKACNWPAPVSQDVDSPAFAKDLRIFLEAHTSLLSHPRATAVDVRDAARWRQFVEMIDPDLCPGGFTIYYATKEGMDQLCYHGIMPPTHWMPLPEPPERV